MAGLLRKTDHSYLNLILLAGIIILFLFHAYYIYNDSNGWMVDDAYISFRYAENFADGKGLVFNENEKVEGYTNFLWVVLLAFFYKIGFYTPDIAVVLGIFFSVCTIIYLYKLSHSFYIQGNLKILSLIAPALLAASNNVALWSFGGLSYPLFMCLSLAGFYYLTGKYNSIAGAVLLSLTALTRPEGMLFAAFSFLYLCFKEKRISKKVLIFTAICGLLVGGHIAFRLWYYGYPLPNTFYNKVGFQFVQLERGWNYLLGYITTYALFLPLIIFVVYVPFKRPEVMLFFFLTLFYLLYIVYTGGDPLPAYRLLLPVIPLIYLLIQLFFSYLMYGPLHHGKSVGFVLSLTLIFFAFCFFNVGRETFVITWEGKELFSGKVRKHYCGDNVARDGAKIGLYFEEYAEPGKTIAVNTAGSIPYFAKKHMFIDMLGLTDNHIAHREMENFGKGYVGHEKNDGLYVLSRKPDYFVFGFSGNTNFIFPGDHVIARQSEFKTGYEKKWGTYDGHHFTYYKRRK
jgi:arabinofuranosyltransferase